MSDVRPLPLGDEENFFSDLEEDEPLEVLTSGTTEGRLVLLDETESSSPTTRHNPFNTSNNSITLSQPRITDSPPPYEHSLSDVSNPYSTSNSSVRHRNGDVTQLDTERHIETLSEQPRQGRHCHGAHQEGIDQVVLCQLFTVAGLTTLFGVAEAIGGYYSNSLAIASDVVHLGSDLLSFIISLMAIFMANRKPTHRMPFGFYRVEILGALLSVFVIWVVTAVLVYLAIRRIIDQDKKIDSMYMIITAAVAVLFNIIMAIVLNVEKFNCKVSHGHSHGDGHGHSHGHSQRPMINMRRQRAAEYQNITEDTDDPATDDTVVSVRSREKNIVIRAAFVHVIGDLLQSLGVLLAALLIYFVPKYHPNVTMIWLADPICTFVFSILVMITTFTVVKDAVFILLEGSPNKISREDIYKKLMNINGVHAIHDLAVWSLTANKYAASCHVAIDDTVPSYRVLEQATEILRCGDMVNRTTIQIERYDPHTMSTCNQCLTPSFHHISL